MFPVKICGVVQEIVAHAKRKIRDVDEVGSGCMYQSVIDSAVRVTMALSDKDMHESKTRTF